MATKKRSSSQHDQGGKIESMMSVAAGCLGQEGAKAIFDAIIPDDDEDDLPMKDGDKILCETLSVVAGCLAQKGVEAIFKQPIFYDGDSWILKGAEKMLCKTLSGAAGGLGQKGAKALYKELRRGNKEKTTKPPEPKNDEAYQELMKTVNALQERVKELEESRQCECQLRANLEKYEGKKEEEISSAEMMSKFEQFLQGIETTEERLPKSPKSSA